MVSANNQLSHQAKLLLSALDQLLEHGPSDKRFGICGNLEELMKGKEVPFSLCYDAVAYLSPGWRDIEEVTSFPVRPYYNSSRWEGEGKKARISLMEHIRERLLSGEWTDHKDFINKYWRDFYERQKSAGLRGTEGEAQPEHPGINATDGG